MFVLKSERFWFFSLSCLYGPSSCQLPPIFLRKNLARLMHLFLFLISLKNRFSVQNLFDTISITVIPWLTWCPWQPIICLTLLLSYCETLWHFLVSPLTLNHCSERIPVTTLFKDLLHTFTKYKPNLLLLSKQN